MRQLPIRARLVASAGPDLARRARAGTFREDLFYRLAVVTVSLPPLVERREDLLPAARALAKAGGGPAAFTAAARRVILGHAWRGNFRELENVVRRAANEARAGGDAAIDAVHLKLASPSDPEALLHAAAHARWSLRQLADAYIALILDEAGGNVTEAARRLGVARKTLYARRASS
jgi:DNA-binding NtrC family response regulator